MSLLVGWLCVNWHVDVFMGDNDNNDHDDELAGRLVASVGWSVGCENWLVD